MELTKLEALTLSSIPENDFYEDGLDSILWTNCFVDCVGIDAKQVRALLVTLQSKGYITVTGGKDGTVALLDFGKQWLIDNSIVDNRGRLIK
jgi:hypothetical protein